MISNIRANGGNVDLDSCGNFILAEDLSDIQDITHIDLSNICSLGGEKDRVVCKKIVTPTSSDIPNMSVEFRELFFECQLHR